MTELTNLYTSQLYPEDIIFYFNNNTVCIWEQINIDGYDMECGLHSDYTVEYRNSWKPL